jgi:hypothetical protein
MPPMCRDVSIKAIAAAAFYFVVTAILGRDVLAHPTTSVLSGPGDSLLNAAILHWDATHVPLTDSWWQFPVFYPSRDAMAFSEHLLGLSPVATPLDWLFGPMAAYNVLALLTFPLCALAMYALMWRLTASSAAAFLSGLVFGFSPYRVAQLTHLQMLAIFWSPLMLLALHAYLDTRRRGWLALYGFAWLMQAATNGYYLFYASLFVAFWVLWFAVARRDWRAVAAVAVTTLVAALPLVPVLIKYLVIHQRNGFVRSIEEIRLYSADLASPFCASRDLWLWHNLRFGCANEGELFPGLVTAAIGVVGAMLFIMRRATNPAAPRRQRFIVNAAGVMMLLFAAAAASVAMVGPWRVLSNPIRISAGSATRPMVLMLLSGAIALSAWWQWRIKPRGVSQLAFYVFAAIACWLFALGPDITLQGHMVSTFGPFRVLMWLPGVTGLRVPARFWGLGTMCLAVIVGLVIAEFRPRPLWRVLVTAMLTVGILSDGWVTVLESASAPEVPSVEVAQLRGHVVMTLPEGDARDLQNTYAAVMGGWRSINGHSGYDPSFYPPWDYAVRFELDAAFLPFREHSDLDVIVDRDASRLVTLVERQSNVVSVATLPRIALYMLPRMPRPETSFAARTAVTVRSATSTCGSRSLAFVQDDHTDIPWECPLAGVDAAIEMELGTSTTVAAVANVVGDPKGFPTELVIETSQDRQSWQPAFSGSVVGDAIRAAIDSPRSPRVLVSFAPRVARYVRVRHPATRDHTWSVSAIEVWSGDTTVDR